MGMTLFLLVAMLLAFAYTFSWTYTPHGRLNYLAAFSLHLLSFGYKFKPDPELDFEIKLPVNLLYGVGVLWPKKKVGRIEDIQFSSGDAEIAARVYWPRAFNEASSPLPIIVYMHGGGFVVGDIDIWDGLTRALAEATTSIVISVDYRLAPRYPYPAAVNDSYAALLWAAENATSIGGNPAWLVVGGDSAGGNLATAVTLKARDENGPSIAAQLLYYPSIDLQNSDYPSMQNFIDGFGLSRESVMAFRQAYAGELDEHVEPYLSPIYAPNLENSPSALVVSAGFDPLTDSVHAFASRLEESGVEVVEKKYPEMIHGFMSIPLFRQYKDALVETGKFMQTVLPGY